jgi:hypothetical protein
MTNVALNARLDALEQQLSNQLTDPASHSRVLPWLGILHLHGRKHLSASMKDPDAVISAAVKHVDDQLDMATTTGGEALGTAVSAAQGLYLYCRACSCSSDSRHWVDDLAIAARDVPLDADAAAHLMRFADTYGLSLGMDGGWPFVVTPVVEAARVVADQIRWSHASCLPLRAEDPLEHSWNASELLSHAMDDGKPSPTLKARVNALATPIEHPSEGVLISVQRSLRDSWALVLAIDHGVIQRVRSGWRPLLFDATEGDWRLDLRHLTMEERLGVLRTPITIDGIDPTLGHWQVVVT